MNRETGLSVSPWAEYMDRVTKGQQCDKGWFLHSQEAWGPESKDLLCVSAAIVDT